MSTLLVSNIQDLSKTVIHQDRLSNQHLSASYLGAVQDDWTFTVNMLVLEYHTTTTDITNLAQFLQTRLDRLSFSVLELKIDGQSTPTIVPPLITLLEEHQALQDTRIRLALSYVGMTQPSTYISSQEAAQHLTQLCSNGIFSEANYARNSAHTITMKVIKRMRIIG